MTKRTSETEGSANFQSINFSNFSLLRNLQPQQIFDFAKMASFRTARKGEIVYSKTDSNKIFFIHSGALKLIEFKDDASESIKDILTVNDIFGEFAEGVPIHTYEYAKVISPKVTYFGIDLSRFKQILTENPSLSYNFYCSLIQKVNRLENRNSNLAVGDPRGRLLHFLRGFKSIETHDGTLQIANFLTQTEMAKMINVSRQTFSRVIKDLRASGELIYTRRKIEITRENQPKLCVGSVTFS
jgi:CRP-like cAMP-binding protein